MKKNVGNLDKIVRLILAVVLAVLFATNIISGTLGIIALVFAAVLLITSSISFCGLYSILGINTCKLKNK